MNRHESNLFAILCYLFFVQVFFYVREFVKSCQKPFCWSFANSNLIFISQDEHCLFFDSSCFCFFFYWKFLDFSLYLASAKTSRWTFFFTLGSPFGTHTIAPSSMSPWLKSPAQSFGIIFLSFSSICFLVLCFMMSLSSAVILVITRRTLPSTAGCGSPKENEPIAPAV